MRSRWGCKWKTDPSTANILVFNVHRDVTFLNVILRFVEALWRAVLPSRSLQSVGGAALNTHELPNNSRYWMRCRATTLMNSRDVIILVPFQNSGKCRWLPVIR